jgi:hypothetical protein
MENGQIIFNFLKLFSASSFLPVSYESAKACAVVIDNNNSNDDAVARYRR